MLRVFRIFPILALAVFWTLSTRHLDLPGPYEDEVLLTIPAIHLITGKPDGPFGLHKNWKIGGRYIALLNQDYLTYLKSYTFIPAFLLNGINLKSVRLTGIVIAGVALLFGFYFMKGFAGLFPAVIGTVLLMTDLSYIFHNRHDWGPVSLMFLFKLSALYFLLKWWRTDRWMYFVVGTACLGLGVLDKANFAWFLFAGFLAFVLTCGLPRDRWRAKHVVILVIFMLAGSFFYIDRNVFSRGRLFTLMKGDTKGWEKFEPGALYQRARYHINLLNNTLDGRVFYRFSTGQELPTPSLFPWLFWLSVPFWVLFGRGRPAKFMFLLNVFTFVAFVLTPQAGGSHHTMAIYPFPHYFAAIVLSQLHERFGRTPRRLLVASGVVTVIIVAVSVSNLYGINIHYAAYQAGKTSKRWTEQIYPLVDYLRANKDRPAHVYDWGIRHNVLFLTEGEIELGEPYWSAMFDPDFEARFERTFPEPGVSYVLHTEEATFMGVARDWFMARAKPKLEAGELRERLIGDGSQFVVYETVSLPRSK